jgi:hypothetical protein
MRKWLLSAALLLTCCGSSSGTGATGIASPSTTTTATGKLLTVNSAGGNASLPVAWSFQIQYPDRYLVTDDSMITARNSQGGVAPPRLAFTVGSPFASFNKSAFEMLNAADRDCVMVFSTLNFQSIADWENLVRTNGPGPVVAESNQHMGGFTYDIREVVVTGASSHSLEAFVALPQNLSYFFVTCKAGSKADLFTMLPTFRVAT